MGYRSQVAYRIVFRNKKILNEFIALVMAVGGDKLGALKECQIEVQDNDRPECYVNYYAEDVKWYEGYREVQAHTRLYEYAAERFPDDADYRFIRTGEDSNDNQEDGSYNGMDDYLQDFYISRIIDTPFDTQYEPVGDTLRILDFDSKV